MRYSLFILLASCFCGATASEAGCSDGFGVHAKPPNPLQPPPVSDNFGKFSFGSDIFFDPKYNNYYSWNYIQNEGTDDLPVEWKEAQISLLGAPLESRGISCKFIPISVTAETSNYDVFIDKKAKITYSSAPNHVQPAWIYIDPSDTDKAKSTLPQEKSDNNDDGSHHDLLNDLKKIFSRFVTDYKDKEGKERHVDITISTSFADNIITFEYITVTPNISTGITNLENIYGEDGYTNAVAQFEKQGFKVEDTYFEKLNSNDLIRKVVPTDEKSRVILLSGQKDASLVFNGKHPTKQNTAVVFYDDNQKLLLVTGMVIYGFGK